METSVPAGNLEVTTSIPTNAVQCDNCQGILRRGWMFTFKTKPAEVAKCLMCSLRHWPMVRMSLLTALVVGTILTLLNQGDKLISGSWAKDFYWKVPLTYCVPYLVATWGALTNSRG